MKIIEHDEKDQKISIIRSMVEGCFHNTPIVILGSGASAAYGVPTMEDLTKDIVEEIEKNGVSGSELNAWETFKRKVHETNNLERSLETIETNQFAGLRNRISEIAWSRISEEDERVFDRVLNGKIELSLSKVIPKLHNGIGMYRSIKIITTNYDRLAEYAIDSIEGGYDEFIHYTGFSYGIIRRPDEEYKDVKYNIARRLGRIPEMNDLGKIKTVEILKVHGSIDWFTKPDKEVIAIPHRSLRPRNVTPAIVTPGIHKYEQTHYHPYEAILRKVRDSLSSASSYLSIGFGFRDQHIQSNLERKIKNNKSNCSIVVLAKKLTSEAKDLFLGTDACGYVLFEENDLGTAVYLRGLNGEAEGFVVSGVKWWDQAEFVGFFLSGR